MRFVTTVTALAAVALAGCPAGPTEPAPDIEGVGGIDSFTYAGTPFTPAGDDLVFVEQSTGTRFNLMGQAFEGALADEGQALGVYPAMTAFWFAWSVHYPGARVWNNGINNEGVELQAGGGCAVPCDEIQSACFGGLDCIPSIDQPVWTTADDDGNLGYLAGDDRVLGLVRPDGAARAYPLDTLWSHEIVNDTWDDEQFSVAYCPLTGSGLRVEGAQDGTDMRFGVSGNLYNSNLVMYDRTTNSLYGQMRMVGFRGDRLGVALDTSLALDTTWEQWRAMFPDTEVLSDDVGPSSYPYGDYRTDHNDTFQGTNPSPDGKYPNKSYAIGVTIGGETVIYAYEELEAELGEVGVLSDEIGGFPVLVAFDLRSQTAAVFSRTVQGETAEFALE